MVEARSKRKLKGSFSRSQTPIRRSNSNNHSKRNANPSKSDIDIISPTFATAGRAAMGSPAPQCPDKVSFFLSLLVVTMYFFSFRQCHCCNRQVVLTLPWDDANPKLKWSPKREGKSGGNKSASTPASIRPRFAPPSLLISMNSATTGDSARSGGGSGGLPGSTTGGHQITPGKMKPQGAYAGRKSVVSKRSQNVLSGLRDVTAFCQSWTQMLDQREDADALLRVPRREIRKASDRPVSWGREEQQGAVSPKPE